MQLTMMTPSSSAAITIIMMHIQLSQSRPLLLERKIAAALPACCCTHLNGRQVRVQAVMIHLHQGTIKSSSILPTLSGPSALVVDFEINNHSAAVGRGPLGHMLLYSGK